MNAVRRLRQLTVNRFGMLIEHLPVYRRLNAMGGSLDKFGANLSFDLCDALRQGRLRQTEVVGGAAEVAMFNQHRKPDYALRIDPNNGDCPPMLR